MASRFGWQTRNRSKFRDFALEARTLVYFPYDRTGKQSRDRGSPLWKLKIPSSYGPSGVLRAELRVIFARADTKFNFPSTLCRWTRNRERSPRPRGPISSAEEQCLLNRRTERVLLWEQKGMKRGEGCRRSAKSDIRKKRGRRRFMEWESKRKRKGEEEV